MGLYFGGYQCAILVRDSSFPINPYNPVLKLPKDDLNIARAEGWQEILSIKANVLISWMYSGV